MLGYYERDLRFIPAHQQPSCLIDLALSRDVDSHRLLRGTGLFYEDILDGQRLISPEQYLRLLDNGRQLLPGHDTSFLFGQRLLPGQQGAASNALSLAANLQDALDVLVRHRARFCPLLAPRLLLDADVACLYWIDACGAGANQRFLVESSMTAVTALCRWLAGEHLPWHYLFNHARPTYVEQYQAHLGLHLTFEAQVDAMLIPREFLVRPWPRASATAAQAAQRDALREQAALGVEEGLLEHIYRQLQREVSDPRGLDALAAHLGISPATCKRKLQKHQTHFQALHDEVRKHVALYLYWSRGYSNEEVAEYLRFNDITNFRRSFKRWTGLVPSAVRCLLGEL